MLYNNCFFCFSSFHLPLHCSLSLILFNFLKTFKKKNKFHQLHFETYAKIQINNNKMLYTCQWKNKNSNQHIKKKNVWTPFWSPLNIYFICINFHIFFAFFHFSFGSFYFVFDCFCSIFLFEKKKLFKFSVHWHAIYWICLNG